VDKKTLIGTVANSAHVANIKHEKTQLENYTA